MKPLASAIYAFCRRLLRPVISILLRSGITYREFASMAKSVYVEVATQEYGLRGRPTNVSRVAMLTGLTRKEVGRQRELLRAQAEPAHDQVHSIARVLMGWYTDAEFLDADGIPLELEPEGEISFASLYQRYSGADVPLTTMRKELLAVAAMEQTPSGRLRVKSRFFRPRAADSHTVDRAGSVLEDLAQTVRYNMYRSGDDRTRFEGRAWSGVIPARKKAEFRELLESRGQQFLEDIDAWLVANEREDDVRDHIRLGVGVYQIESQSAVVAKGQAEQELNPVALTGEHSR